MAKKMNLGRVRGTEIYTGSAITGVDANGKTFPGSGISKAYAEDLYINTDDESDSHGNVYTCITAGGAEAAVWAYSGNLRGPSCEVVNNLESNRTDAALTAYQGQVLKNIMSEAGTITWKVIIDYPGNVQGIKVITESKATTITVTTESGDITQEKNEGAETTLISAVPARKITKITSTDAYIKKIELRDKNGDLVYTDDRSVWPAVEELRTQIEEAQSIRDGETELTAGIVSKVRNGIKKVLYPVTHAKAVWYSMKDNQTVYDVVAGLLEKVKKLGPGDMLKSTYDPNGDGVVDNASKLGGQDPTYYQKASDDTLKTENKTVVGAVNEVQEMAKSGGRDLIGKEFLGTKDYAVGKHAIKDNKRYRFTTEHPAGEWDESHVVEATVDEEMEDLTEKLAVVEVDMTSAKLNTNVSVSYPAGFYRKNCVIMGISVYDRVNNNYYSLFGDTTVTAMLGANVIVKTSQSNYIGAGSKIRVVLYKIA